MPVTVTILLEKPVVNVPRDLNGNAVDFDPLIAPELPLQSLNLEHLLAVDGEREFGGVVPGAAIDLNVSASAAEFGGGGVEPVGEDVFLLEEEELGLVGLLGLGLGIGVPWGVADEESHAVIDDECDVERRVGFGGGRGRELGLGEVPEEAGGGGEGLGAVLLPEDEGLDVEVEGSGGRRGWRGIEGVVVEVELEVEGAA